MSGSDGVFNIAKGRVAYYAGLPAASDALIATLWTSIASDATIKDLDTLAAIEADASSAEATTGTVSDYVRKTLGSVTVTVDDSNDRVDVDCADITWTGLGGANNTAIVKLIICYDADTGSGTDSDIIPLTYHTFDLTPDNSDVTATVANFFRAS